LRGNDRGSEDGRKDYTIHGILGGKKTQIVTIHGREPIWERARGILLWKSPIIYLIISENHHQIICTSNQQTGVGTLALIVLEPAT